MSAYQSKGLEFDAVILFNVNNTTYNDELEKQLLYVSITRALHDLKIIYSGQPSEFIQSYFKGAE